MPCRRLTKEEFEKIVPGTRGFRDESECLCCSEGCCLASMYYSHRAVAVSQGWRVLYVDDFSAYGGFGTAFEKVVPCGSETVLEWRYADGFGPQEETYSTDPIGSYPGRCCGDTCIGYLVDECNT